MVNGVRVNVHRRSFTVGVGPASKSAFLQKPFTAFTEIGFARKSKHMGDRNRSPPHSPPFTICLTVHQTVNAVNKVSGVNTVNTVNEHTHERERDER
jgi:hypothetical protein